MASDITMGEDPDATALREAKERLGNLPIEEVLRRGRDAMLQDLAARAELGTITKAEMTILRNLLKDNGMTLVLPPPEPSSTNATTAKELRGSLPDLPDAELD